MGEKDWYDMTWEERHALNCTVMSDNDIKIINEEIRMNPEIEELITAPIDPDMNIVHRTVKFMTGSKKRLKEIQKKKDKQKRRAARKALPGSGGRKR